MIKKFGALVAASVLATVGIGFVSVGTSPATPLEPAARTTVETTNISTVIIGNATKGSTVNVVCVVEVISPPPGVPPTIVNTAELNFDEHGNPSTKSGPLSEYWSASGTSWVSVGNASPLLGRQTCAHTMINNGGANSTSWTCDFISNPAAPSGVGCVSAAGSDRGPIVLNWALSTDGLVSETANLVFTSTYPDVVKPSFTG
ncbi:MAG: hypothetical protein WCJ88_12600 [Actinomycetes bacterium]